MIKYGYVFDDDRTKFLSGRSSMEQYVRLQRMGCDLIISDMYGDDEGDRKNLLWLQNNAKAGDIVIVARLEVLGRTVELAAEVVDTFIKRGVLVNIEEIGLIGNGITGDVFLRTISAVREIEKSLLLQKAAERKVVSRTKYGRVEGRPRIPEEIIDAALNKIKNEGYSYKQASDEFGVSEATLYKAAARKRGEDLAKN